jgi:hypothetical protein
VEIKDAFKLGELQYRNLYRQLDAWTKEGLLEKKPVSKLVQRKSRTVYIATKKLDEYMKSLKNL